MIRRIIGQIHLWTGVVLFVPLVVLGVTGSILVFEDELNRAFGPSHRAAGGAARPTSEIVAAARAVGACGLCPGRLYGADVPRWAGVGAPLSGAARHPRRGHGSHQGRSGLSGNHSRTANRNSAANILSALHPVDEEPRGPSARRLARAGHARDGCKRAYQLVAATRPVAGRLLDIQTGTRVSIASRTARGCRYLGSCRFRGGESSPAYVLPFRKLPGT